MADLKRLDVTEFDFDEVKDNLKTFLRGQSEFTDYDFEGAGMNILLDVLAYNTHYLGFNANMLANEMFIDSASLRSSVVSHAKTLGYEPNSVSAPTAVIDVTMSNVSNSTRTISKGTKFDASVVLPDPGKPIINIIFIIDLLKYDRTLIQAFYLQKLSLSSLLCL